MGGAEFKGRVRVAFLSPDRRVSLRRAGHNAKVDSRVGWRAQGL